MTLSHFTVLSILTLAMSLQSSLSQSPACLFQCQTTSSSNCNICYNTCKVPLSSSQPNIFDDKFVFLSCQQRTCIKQQKSDLSCLQFGSQTLTEQDCVKSCCNYSRSIYFTRSSLRQCLSDQNHFDTTPQSNTVLVFFSLVGGAILAALLLAFAIYKIRQFIANRQNVRPISNLTQSNPSLSTEVDFSINKKHVSTIFKTSWEKSKEAMAKKQWEQNCAICLQIRMNCRTACGHKFHLMCLKEWINKNPDCPLCKSKHFNDVKVYCVRCRSKEATIELNRKLRLKTGSGDRLCCDHCKNDRFYEESSWTDLNSIQ